MKRAFIRGIWGDITEKGMRDGKICKDIECIKNNPYTEKFITYVFGEDNKKYLEEKGFDCVLVDVRPVIWDMEKQLYRHKLDILKAAMNDFDEIVFLDWDCIPTIPLVDGFWDALGKKAPFQANLFQYRTKKCLWRSKDWRKVCNGGFLYLRDKKIPDEFIQKYNELSEWVKEKKKAREKQGKKLRFREEALMFDDEPAFSKWTDEYTDGWKNLEMYWKTFEPEVCNLKKKAAFPKEMLEGKCGECFVHWG